MHLRAAGLITLGIVALCACTDDGPTPSQTTDSNETETSGTPGDDSTTESDEAEADTSDTDDTGTGDESDTDEAVDPGVPAGPLFAVVNFYDLDRLEPSSSRSTAGKSAKANRSTPSASSCSPMM
jgi:hypothetical protein